MKKTIRCTMIAIVGAMLILTLGPAMALATPEANPDGQDTSPVVAASSPDLTTQAVTLPASGTWGTCSWSISSSGILTVHPGTAPGATFNSSYNRFVSPWDAYKGVITKAVFKAENGKRVVVNNSCAYLFYNFSKMTSIDLS